LTSWIGEPSPIKAAGNLDDIAAMDSADAIARRPLGDRPDLKNRHYAILVTNGGNISSFLREQMTDARHRGTGRCAGLRSQRDPAPIHAGGLAAHQSKKNRQTKTP
jgi:hypothetical protein